MKACVIAALAVLGMAEPALAEEAAVQSGRGIGPTVAEAAGPRVATRGPTPLNPELARMYREEAQHTPPFQTVTVAGSKGVSP
jgi:hypothetical protein